MLGLTVKYSMLALVVGSGAGYTACMFKQRSNIWWPLLGFSVALVLRLWNVGVPAQIVSDEVSFVNDGRAYVRHQTYFDPHPPLGKLGIGVAIQMFGDRPFVWRIVGAVEGAGIIPLLWWIVWRLTKRQSAATITMVLALVDGLLLVDSRLGLINIPYLFASLLAFAAVIKGLSASRPWPWLLLSGLFLGLGLSTKWIAVLVGIPLIICWIWPTAFGLVRNQQQKFSPWQTLLAFGIIPPLVYWVVFVIHFAWLGLPQTFWATNFQMLQYHVSVPSVGDPYKQPWLGWLLAWRPFPYWTEVIGDQISILRSLPNPWVWWSGSLLILYSLISGWRMGTVRLIHIFLLAAWLPFVFVQRIMYSYHALLFDIWMLVFLGIFLDRFWDRQRRRVITYISISVITFVWFAPWYLNIAMPQQQHRLRQWLPTWTVTL